MRTVIKMNKDSSILKIKITTSLEWVEWSALMVKLSAHGQRHIHG